MMKVFFLINLFTAVLVITSYGQVQNPKDGYVYYCTACGDGSCDTIAYNHPGICPICKMSLRAKSITKRNDLHGDTISFEKFIGYWVGSGRSGEQELKFSLEITKDHGNKVMFNSDEMGVQNVPGNDIKIVNDSIQFDLTGDKETLSFKAGFKQGKVSGMVNKVNHSKSENETPVAIFELSKTQKGMINYAIKEVSWKNGDAILSGSLYLPNSNTKFPAIVFTHGSGPEQRYANAYMADYFAKKGIAVLIYDKRGTGKSTGNWQTSTYEDLSEDCIAGIKYLKRQSKINSAEIGIFGHSQGGTISPLIISRSHNIAFNIASAAFGVSPEEQDIYRVSNILRSDAGFSEKIIDSAIGFYKIWVELAKTGSGRDKLEKEMPRVKNTQWYAWVAPPPKDNWIWKWYLNAGNYTPISYWEKIKIPVLLLYGEKDLITPPAASVKNIQAALIKAGNSNYKIVMFPNTTHEGHILGKSNDFWDKTTPGYCDTVYNWLKSKIIGK